MSEQSLTAWLNLHRSGDPDAARQLFEHFAQRLAHLAQRHLTARVRQRVDGEDIVQSVFRSFFTRDAQGQFHIDNADDLWKLLVTLTLRKARGVWRKNTTEGRDVNREQPSGDSWLLEAVSREPTVIEALVLADQIDVLLDGLSPEHVRVLELRLAGYTPTEVAEEMHLSRQSVWRLLQPLRERLEHANRLAVTDEGDTE